MRQADATPVFPLECKKTFFFFFTFLRCRGASCSSRRGREAITARVMAYTSGSTAGLTVPLSMMSSLACPHQPVTPRERKHSPVINCQDPLRQYCYVQYTHSIIRLRSSLYPLHDPSNHWPQCCHHMQSAPGTVVVICDIYL